MSQTKFMYTFQMDEDLWERLCKLENQKEIINKAIRAYFASQPTSKTRSSN